MRPETQTGNSALTATISELKAENDILEAKLTQLRSSLEASKATKGSNVSVRVKKAEDEIIKGLKSELTALKEELKRRNALNEELGKKAEKAAEDKQVEIAKTASKEEERKKLELQLAEQLTRFEAEKAEEEKKRIEDKEKLTKLETSVIDLTAKIEAKLLDAEKDFKEKLKKQEEEKKSAEESKIEAEARVLQLKKEKEELKAKNVEENKKILEYGKELADLQKNFTKQEEALVENKRLLLEKEKGFRDLEAEKRKLSAEHAESLAASEAAKKAEIDDAIKKRDDAIKKRDDAIKERDAAKVDAAEARETAKEVERAAREAERDAAKNDALARTAERDAAQIDAAGKEKLRIDALARLTASERDLSDLQKSSSHELSIARSQRDKALEEIERLHKKLEKQSSAPEHKIIREFEKAFKPNYKKACDLLFEGKTEEVKKNEIDYYRNHRHKIYQDDDAKFAHTKIDLSEASDEEVMKEIAKDRERAVRNSLPKLVKKLIGRNNNESVIEKLSCTDIVIALSVGNSEEFDQWKKENPDANIINTFFGNLEKGSKEQKIRSKAIENLLEGIKGYSAFFGVDDSKVLEPDIKPNNSPRILTIDGLAKKFKSRSAKFCAA